MTIWNLGSINADHVYAVPHIPTPGETLAATGLSRGLGGKGANMSVAAARAGARVAHLGAVGEDGGWMVERLEAYGVDCAHVQRRGALRVMPSSPSMQRARTRSRSGPAPTATSSPRP